jgi:hypothetical protein
LAAQASSALAAQTAPAHDSILIESQVLHERRPINVHVPHAYHDRGRRFQVLYMPDGGMDEDFPHVVRAVDSLTAAGIIPPTIVVGIPNIERRRDLTGPTRVASDSAVAPHVGGSAAFRAFIRDELIPLIDTRYRTTPHRAIVGESLAGLFIVETFLREPAMFERYAAFDPSLWWNRGALVDSAAALLSAAITVASTRLFVASSRDDIDAQTSRLAGILRAGAPRDLVWRFEPHPELTHATIFAGLEASALVHVLK